MSDVPTLTPDLTDPALSDAELATRLVRRAGALAARMRAEGLTADTKTSITDVVTAADHAAEELVTGALLAARPDDGILGEEGARHTSRSGRTWVIDPVDGTYNFLSGLPTWCSALALAVDGETALGAVHQPSIDETWVGGVGHPTTFDGRALEPLADLPLSEVALATYLHPASMDRTGVRERWLRVVEGAATVRMLGSGSCELAAVAAGRLGAWAQESVAEWDWRPGAALVRAAGGEALQVEAAGTTWSVAGRPSAVAEIVARLGA